MANEQSASVAEKQAAQREIQQLFDAVLTAPYADKANKKTDLKNGIRRLSGADTTLFREYFKYADKLVKAQNRVTFTDDEWLEWMPKTLEELNPANFKKPIEKSAPPATFRQISLALFRLVFPIGTFFSLPYNVYQYFLRRGKKDVQSQTANVVESTHIIAGLLQVVLIAFFIAAVIGAGPFAPLAALGLPVLIGITLGLAMVVRGIGAALATALFINPYIDSVKGSQIDKPSVLGSAVGYALLEKSLPDYRKYMNARAASRPASVTEMVPLMDRSGQGSMGSAGSSVDSSPRGSISTSSTASALGKLAPPRPLIHASPASTAAAYALHRQVQTNKMQLAQEQESNYLSYSDTRLSTARKTLLTLKDGIEKNSADPALFADDKETLAAMLPTIEQLLSRMDKVEQLHAMVRKIDSTQAKVLLLNTKSELDKIAESESKNPGKEMDLALNNFEEKLKALEGNAPSADQKASLAEENKEEHEQHDSGMRHS